MNIGVIINQSCDPDQKQKELINEAAKAKNIHCDIYYCEGAKIHEVLNKFLENKYATILIGGGDGTINSAGQFLTNKNIPLAVLPLGTYNHFAKSLNLSSDIHQIMKSIAENKIKAIDYGQINDLYFINNASIGLYPQLKLKQQSDNVISRGKIYKLIWDLINFRHPLRFYDIEMEIQNKTIVRRTFLLFISNNYYYFKLFKFGERESLVEGELCVYIVHCKNRFEFVKLIWRLLMNKYNKTEYLEFYSTKKLVINSKKKKIDIALDGEVFKINPPLHFKINRKDFPIIDSSEQ